MPLREFEAKLPSKLFDQKWLVQLALLNQGFAPKTSLDGLLLELNSNGNNLLGIALWKIDAKLKAQGSSFEQLLGNQEVAARLRAEMVRWRQTNPGF